MYLYIEEEGDKRLPLDVKKLAERAVEETLTFVGCPYETEVNLLLTENPQIRQINSEQRGIDRETDVLSFPMADYETPGEFEGFQEETFLFHPETGRLLLGDIVLSKEKVLEQAEEFGHSVEREYTFLIVHSMLHLMGYDHMEELQRQEMEELQRQIMEKLNLLR